MVHARQPTMFLAHGGGPCFFMDWDPPGAWDRMRTFLASVPGLLPERPRAVLVVSAHVEADPVTISAGAAPDLLFDYYGFPPHTYELTYPAPGDPALATEVHRLLTGAGLPAALDPDARFDHGVFVPLKVVWPDASIPVVAVSLHPSLDPSLHLALGAALAPLRDEGVLIVGSGASYHGRTPDRSAVSQAFDGWLDDTMTSGPAVRSERLQQWTSAPHARSAHPREEHLIPLMVAAGAAGTDAATRVYTDTVLEMRYGAWAFGDVSVS